jgi:hypothetical protein
MAGARSGPARGPGLAERAARVVQFDTEKTCPQIRLWVHGDLEGRRRGESGKGRLRGPQIASGESLLREVLDGPAFEVAWGLAIDRVDPASLLAISMSTLRPSVRNSQIHAVSSQRQAV